MAGDSGSEVPISLITFRLPANVTLVAESPANPPLQEGDTQWEGTQLSKGRGETTEVAQPGNSGWWGKSNCRPGNWRLSSLPPRE